MIAPRNLFDDGPPPVLRLGDEPADLARGRLLYRLEEGMHGRPPRVCLPGRGEVPPPTTLQGEDGEWLLRHARGRIPADADWLRALPAVAEGDEAAPLPPAVGRTALRDIAVLLAAARRSAAHDLAFAFDVLAGPPERVRADRRLRAFREEVNRAVGPALGARPQFAWRIALLAFVSAESVEDIVAARWRDRLDRYAVLAANPGPAAGRILYAWRAPAGFDAAEILAAAAPPGAPPPRSTAGGASGRGAASVDEFAALLRGLRFRETPRLLTA